MLDSIWDHISPFFHKFLDTAVISAGAVTFMGWLPDITALFVLIYLLIRIWETDTIRELTNRVKSGE